VYLAVADEEAGGREGTGWLLEAHPELFQGVEAVFNEGGANRVIGDRLLYWGVEIQQKRPLWLEVTARGRGGHGSGLRPASATHQLVRGLAQLVERPMRYRVSDAARSYLTALAEIEGGTHADLYRRLDDVIQPAGPQEPLPPGLDVFFLDTLQVTEIDSGQGINVVAPEARAYVDVRLLPDSDGDAFLADVREALGPDLEVRVLLSSPPTSPAPVDHPVYRQLVDVLAVHAPVVPTFIAGTTDSRYFRERGIPAYGLAPFVLNSDELRGIHGLDESIPEAAFLRGVETMRRVLREIAAPKDPG
jgi:acetylornithine deacetylase/succinyl-diaminopimelate desuccinylase-like protein